jgi:hypothetical protein
MADTITSIQSAWDSKQGSYVTTTTLESFSAYPTIPSTAVDVQKQQTGGKYVITYREISGGSSTNLSVHSSLSTEPLKTHPVFASGGTYALSDSALQSIKEAEQGTTSWKTLMTSSDPALSKYSRLAAKGIESYLVPSITLSVSTIEGSLPNLNSLGKKATPTYAPTLPGSANWLLSGCNAESQANGSYKITREYRASASNGWNNDLYGAS